MESHHLVTGNVSKSTEVCSNLKNVQDAIHKRMAGKVVCYKIMFVYVFNLRISFYPFVNIIHVKKKKKLRFICGSHSIYL